MKTGFWKLSTAGNTTLFLEKRCDAARALSLIAAEQAGFVDFPERHLDMAGGEFCVNACLAYGALLEALGFFSGQMSIGKKSVQLQAIGKMPVWQVCATFSPPAHTWEERELARICHMEGISHALINCQAFPAEKDSFSQARAMLESMNLDTRAASGVVWWRQNEDSIELQPVVSVPALGTFNLEKACGSASIALALAQGPGKYELMQPSGKSLLVEAGKDFIQVAAEIALQAAGELWC